MTFIKKKDKIKMSSDYLEVFPVSKMERNKDQAVGEKARIDAVIDMIAAYIKNNNLPVGARLPSERALAESFGVSRAAVHEAARVLHVLNILDIRQQGGMFIAEPGSNSRFDYFKLIMQSGKVTMAEIFETRLIMEVECIALAAANITDEQISQLDAIVSSVSIDDPEGFSEADKNLHALIYAASANRAMQILMQTVSTWSMVTRKYSNSFVEVRRLVQTDHENICAALKARDVEKSRESMRAHIMHLMQIYHIEDTIVRSEFAALGKNVESA